MRSVLTGFILSITFLLLIGCGEKEEVAMKPVEETSIAVENESIYDVISENGVHSLYVQYLPQLKPCLLLVNQYNELSVFYDAEFDMIWVFVPSVHGVDDWEFLMNGKSVKGIEYERAEIHASLEEGRVILERFTNEQLPKRDAERGVEILDCKVTCIGYGVKFDESDVLKMKGLASSYNGTQYFTVDYNPDDGWSYQCDAPLIRRDFKADVFGFSKKNMMEQFKEVFKKKKECLLRFNRPYRISKLTKFSHVEYVKDAADDFAEYGFIVDANSIIVCGDRLTDKTTLKWNLREILNTISALKDANDEREPMAIDLHEDCNDDYFRILLGELDHSSMNRFELRIVPKKP